MFNKFNKNKEVENWWNENPFTFGAAKNDYGKHDQVGKVEEGKMDLKYFNEVEKDGGNTLEEEVRKTAPRYYQN